MDDLDALRTRVGSLGAVRERSVRQRDTFFPVPRGRLKLREETGGARIIYYQRPDTPDAKVSRVQLAPVTDPAGLAALLAAALGAGAIVEKRREIWRWEGVQLHLDEVERLGRFIELEETVDDEAALPAALDHVRDLGARLGIPAAALAPTAYADMLEMRPIP